MDRVSGSSTERGKATKLSRLEKHLLNDFQHGLPLSPTPFADIAAKLDVSEEAVISTLERLQNDGMVSRVGAVFRPNGVGVSTLAALAVPEERLDEVAELISSYEAVNHNYQREHHFNLWFVATAADETELKKVLDEIEGRCGLEVLYLPMLEDYHIDLGFELKWT